MVLGVLFAASPRPPHSLGVLHKHRGTQNPLIAARHSKTLASELSLPPTGRQSLSSPAAWCDKVPANGTGQSLQSSHLPTALRCPGGNACPSIPHPLTPPQPPLAPSVPQPSPQLSSGAGQRKELRGVHVVAKGGKPVYVMLSAANAGEQQPGRKFGAHREGSRI